MSEANDTAISVMLGELRGQVREMTHTQNNMLMKLDAIGSQVMQTSVIPEQLASLKTEYTALNLRLTAMELSNSQRAGRDGVIAAVLQSKAFGWVVGAVTTVGLYLNGNIKI